jgi:ribonuclease R/exosome complex exonuclease DIS3/RRP44
MTISIGNDHAGTDYKFDQDEYALIGQATKNKYQLGDEVVVKVKQADLVKKHLDFSLIGKKE